MGENTTKEYKYQAQKKEKGGYSTTLIKRDSRNDKCDNSCEQLLEMRNTKEN